MSRWVPSPSAPAQIERMAATHLSVTAGMLARDIEGEVDRSTGPGTGFPSWPYSASPSGGPGSSSRVTISSSTWHWLEYGYSQFGDRYVAPRRPIARAVQGLGMRWEDAGG